MAPFFKIIRYVRWIAPAISIVLALIFIFNGMNSGSFNMNTGRLNSLAGGDYYMGSGDTTYVWYFSGVSFHLNLTFDENSLSAYEADDLHRDAGGWVNAMDLIPEVATPNDPLIATISAQFSSAAYDLGLGVQQRVNLMLSFVQSIPTIDDLNSTGQEEYWRFPVETLQARQGDMIDKSVLLASLCQAGGCTSVVLLDNSPGVRWEQAHVSVGVNCPGATGTYYEHDGQRYFCCETTYVGFLLGDSDPNTFNAYCAHLY